MKSKVHQIDWFQSGNLVFIFGINSEILYILTRRNRPPNRLNHKTAPLTHKIAPWGDFAHVEYHWCIYEKRKHNVGHDDFLLSRNIGKNAILHIMHLQHRDCHKHFFRKVVRENSGFHPKYKLNTSLKRNF